MAAVPEWLNYGAFGLLVIVLIAVGRFGYIQFTKSLDHNRRLAEMANGRADRADTRADKLTDSWIEIVESNVAVNERIATLMDDLCDTVKEDRTEARQEHQEILKEVMRKERQ